MSFAGGEVSIEDTPGDGATFAVDVPSVEACGRGLAAI
jgi:hypothetical protein